MNVISSGDAVLPPCAPLSTGTFGALGLEAGDGGAYVPERLDRLWAVGIVQVACGDNHRWVTATLGSPH
eukprot:2012330-Pyramimonas_sp.AAC.1